MAVNPKRTVRTNKHYRNIFGYLADWRMRPLDAIGRRDVEDRFNSLTRNHGWAPANMSISLLGSIYRRPCVDLEGLRNPVELWRAGGGKYHPPKRRKISAPAEVLPRWKKGIETEAIAPVARDAFRFGLYTGMRLKEVLPLRWERVDMTELVFRVDETKTGAPLELPITRQLSAILERRRAEIATLPGGLRDWVFPSSASASGHVVDLAHFYGLIGETGGTKFWYHALRNCFHHSGRARPAATPHFDQAAGQPRPAQRNHRGIRGRLDHRATVRTRAGHRRPDRRHDERNRGGGSVKLAIGGIKPSSIITWNAGNAA